MKPLALSQDEVTLSDTSWVHVSVSTRKQGVLHDSFLAIYQEWLFGQLCTLYNRNHSEVLCVSFISQWIVLNSGGKHYF